MCGIAGLITRGALDEQLVSCLVRPLAHRGPDDSGIWLDSEAGVGLGHRRLAIVDLSTAGRQPMASADGRFILTFNGEIYNHAELRSELEQIGAVPRDGWRGHSDTEVFLQAVLTWGLSEALRRSAGMFAFGLWDRRTRSIFLVRDRFGEKPLYYGWVGKDFLFGSELKAFRAHPSFTNAIDRSALALFTARTYIPVPFSIYEGIFKLPAGCILTVSAEAATRPLRQPPSEGDGGGISLHRYWAYRDVVRRGLNDPIDDEVDAINELERVLGAAIKHQSIADVPVGAFLSGGFDSSTICALYQKHSAIPIRTFSIGFEEAAFNEAEDAKRVAAHLGTVHHEHYVTIEEAREVIPLLPSMYDEPFADSSQIPTYLVSRFAREHVSVALTGDGGDELFAGYNRHFVVPRMWQQVRKVPRSLRTAAGAPLSRVPSRFWEQAARYIPSPLPAGIGLKLRKAFSVATSADTLDDIYAMFLDEWSESHSPVLGASGRSNEHDLDLGPGAADVLRIMYGDAVGYLPDDILVKVDRASMAVSLETRVPFLDHSVAELAARIPLSLKVRKGRGKHVVRQLLYRDVPAALVDRPKAGFGIPVGRWLKGPLRPWAEDLLEPNLICAQGWLDSGAIQKLWKDHLSGRRDATPAIWAILMFQSWLSTERETNAVDVAAAMAAS